MRKFIFLMSSLLIVGCTYTEVNNYVSLNDEELLTNEKIPCCYALLFIIHKLLRGCKRSYSVKLLPVLITAPHQFNY